MFKYLGLFLITLGCASPHPGSMTKSPAKDVLISVNRNGDLSDKNYIFYEYTIENKTSDWKDVQIIDVDFVDEETEVLTGEKLSAWIEGAENKLKISEYNDQLLLGSMIAVSGLTAATNQNPVAIGALATSVSLASGSAVGKGQKTTNSGPKGEDGTVNVPKTHAFVPSKIAPQSFVRRWIVVGASKNNFMDSARAARGEVLLQANLVTKTQQGPKKVEYSAVVNTIHRKL